MPQCIDIYPREAVPPATCAVSVPQCMLRSNINRTQMHGMATFRYHITHGTVRMLQEYCNGGSLRELLNGEAFTQDAVRSHWGSVMAAVSGIAQGMAYIHSKRICHGDLNPANVLVQVWRLPHALCTSTHHLSALLLMPRQAWSRFCTMFCPSTLTRHASQVISGGYQI